MATPRGWVVAGLVSVVGQGVAFAAPYVGPALESAKAIVEHRTATNPDGSNLAADLGIGWANRCVAAYRKAMQVFPEAKELPEECATPIGSNFGSAAAADEQSNVDADTRAESSISAHSMWVRQLDGSDPSDPAGATPRRNEQGKSARAFEDMQVAVAPDELDQMRGGFEMSGGFKFNFGFERAVYINGQLVTTQTLNSSDFRDGATAGQAAAASLAADHRLNIIQNGAGNTFVPIMAAGTSGTGIQNTLNDQTIKSQTIINASVNSMQALRSLNIQSAVRDGIIGSLRR